MNVDHTPGPWEYDGVRVFAPAFDEKVIVVVDGEPREHGQGLIALPYSPVLGGCEANARLIVAAPDMYDELRELAELSDAAIDEGDPSVLGGFRDAARRLVAKVGGR